MEWSRLISDKRLGLEEYHDERHHIRSEFQRDYDRMIFSSPFRRLQNKTQVFPLPGSIFVHNRLTHSLEVASVGRSIANEVLIRMADKDDGLPGYLGNIPDIVATACLCHDLGNPPFGHNGEKAISTFFSEGKGVKFRDILTARQWSDVTNFEGNANSFRLLTHQFVGRRHGGFAMTYSTLASVVKYPYSSSQSPKAGKFGFFESEESIFRKIASELGIPELSEGRFARHPLVFIMEAADDICYQIMDIEDAHRLKILSLDEVTDLLTSYFEPTDAEHCRRSMQRLYDPNEKVAYLRSKVIGMLVADCARAFVAHEGEILSGSVSRPLTDMLITRLGDAYSRCSETAWAKIYCASDVVDVEIAGNRILTYLMECLTDAVLHPNRNFSKLLLSKVPQQYDTNSENLYTRLQSVLDHVSGMTDVYALDLFRKLNGHSLPAV
ncbi:MAG: dNTP triphosphohydrolase [Prevotella sp.]|nr:dNTP triphosphohydrolase [Bacteroides sp.]MCM1366452.1 dNTP triphosphohydrolase [Prevotella sp.]MCM1437068.1 dNTP triphosphohydrolase [Prevotella sp.]